jgi:flagellar basal body-associated protein FliL
MFFTRKVEEEKKSVSVFKIILIAASVAAAVAAVVTVLMFWKKKKCVDKQLEAEIDAVVDEAFAAEEESAEEAEA